MELNYSLAALAQIELGAFHHANRNSRAAGDRDDRAEKKIRCRELSANGCQ
jgi:hypothetical protein